MKVSNLVFSVLIATAGFTSMAYAQSEPQTAQTEKVSVGNKICPVSGQQIEGSGMDGATYEYKGKVYHLCCPGCISVFEGDPEKYSKIAEDEEAKEAK